jgi:hypothetical protein
MKILTDFALKEEYKRLESVGDKLSEINSLIYWKPFRIILESIYSNKTVSGGRPETDVIVMFKMLISQQWHGLSDPELEKQCIDRISFRKFLGFPECQRRLRIPHFRRIKIPQFSILEKSSRIVDHAENGGMVIDTRFIFTRLEHKRNRQRNGF